MSRAKGLAALLALTLVVTTDLARADDARCVAAFESTQLLRREGKLQAARAEALACSASSCPRVVVRDCATWFGEIEAAIPTLVFAASTASRELVDVEVSVDGVAVTQRLDGRARAVEPGAHRIRFVASGYAPTEVEVVVVEGEKNRKVASVLSPLTPRVPLTPEAPHDRGSSRKVPVASWILGGVSLAAFAGASVFAVDGLGKRSDLDDLGCKPSCDDRAVSSMSTSFVTADVLAGVGLVAAATAIVLYVTQTPPAPAAGSTRRASFTF